MLEDRLLVLRFKRGNRDAFCRIYEKYRNDLLRLAVSLLNESSTAEDVVHDVFTSFIRSGRQFELTGSLKGYLATCVANRARNVSRGYRRKQDAGLDKVGQMASDCKRPDQWITCSEELQQISNALAQLPYDQREAITLHLQAGMKFREIAEFQEVPIKTAQSRYRCGLDKLRLLLNSETTN
ncbi:MAG: sigma-70 family RNA polymerase sigma factor [Phycisphaerae bacterium]|nr:RNA polymerase sigma factor [Phycisphaerae bacterium]NIP50582.1 RNA polymerase sigma factor [Phycisphaerae bacterium]NIS50793.1 RNA polymerase sigma factor [Phycisphaerae bacterium]NIU07470.1 RNA polymerase sigma factor [Phycisphaerae bacterium]NIU55060.1 sigma-70 family RNA polymerase sigma factor [Phycisphaerae bacterium]